MGDRSGHGLWGVALNIEWSRDGARAWGLEQL